jgi:leucyl/phenylalanyl-tRNA---protein transferase
MLNTKSNSFCHMPLSSPAPEFDIAALMNLTPAILLEAYAAGFFPMAENAGSPGLFWVEPKIRGVIPLDGFHISHSLARTVRRNAFDIRINHDFAAVIDGCSGAGIDRPETWINPEIRELYGALFEMGRAHTVECWQDNQLVGGLYGVCMGGAFFGESMFHRVTDASKIALVHLVARLKKGGFILLDAQFQTAHLAQFGAIEVQRKHYLKKLSTALTWQADWSALPLDQHEDGKTILEMAAKQSEV